MLLTPRLKESGGGVREGGGGSSGGAEPLCGLGFQKRGLGACAGSGLSGTVAAGRGSSGPSVLVRGGTAREGHDDGTPATRSPTCTARPCRPFLPVPSTELGHRYVWVIHPMATVGDTKYLRNCKLISHCCCMREWSSPVKAPSRQRKE